MNEPQLQPPGAGLPFLENLFIRHIFMPRMKRKYPWDKADEFFEQQSRRSINLCRDLPQELLTKRVLIPRIRGIEDSSRYWSIDMTMEHMVIVAKGIADIIETLSAEKTFPKIVNTADVKPVAGNHPDMAKKYIAEMKDITRRMKQISHRSSQATHIHPWLGPLNNNEWHVVLATHQYLHNHQIRQIIAGLHR